MSFCEGCAKHPATVSCVDKRDLVSPKKKKQPQVSSKSVVQGSIGTELQRHLFSYELERFGSPLHSCTLRHVVGCQ